MLLTGNNMSDESHATARQGRRGQRETEFEEVELWSRYSITRSAREQHRRHVDAERFGRFQVDDQLITLRRLDR
jgi:hypothetical protein